MHSNDWSRLLTERQREVLSIVVENKVYRNRDSKIPELSPSEQGKRVYERLELEPRPENKQTAEALDRQTITILRFLRDHPDASSNEIAEELGLSDYTTGNGLRVLIAIQLVTKQRGAAVRRGVPPFVFRPTPHGRDLIDRLPIGAVSEDKSSVDGLLGTA